MNLLLSQLHGFGFERHLLFNAKKTKTSVIMATYRLLKQINLKSYSFVCTTSTKAELKNTWRRHRPGASWGVAGVPISSVNPEFGGA